MRTRSALTVGEGGLRLLRFCTDPDNAVHTNYSAPIGRPIIHEPSSPAQFALLCAWLRRCDESHYCNKHRSNSKIALPTQVLYVGDPKDSGYNSDYVRLVHTLKTSRQEYIALSHCWGNLSFEEKKMYCTTQDNISQRLQGFSVTELPKTFQDAVKVTRELGVLYLWIDSLCIIQYGDNGEDWKSESSRMESVFSQAYCTIAATATADSNAGFLKRDVNPKYVYIQDTLGNQFYISSDTDNFDNDVGKAKLNTRAWVMQERVLARRTIHFSANQTYWECGEGVYCENLTILASSIKDRHITLDPNFPDELLRSGIERTINFLSFLFQDYSKRDLTFPTDRRVAISGLENRIASALKCQSRYGVFQKYLHRNLLWQPSDNKMKRIAYENQDVPSWSWMAYIGGVQFMDIPYAKVSWINNLWFDKERQSALIAEVGKFQRCTIKPDSDHYAMLDRFRRKRGRIQYDVEDGEELGKEKCVVVGRTKKSGVEEYYILVVVPTTVAGEYRRVGAGLIESGYVARRTSSARVV